MNIKACLQRVVTFKVYTIIGFFIVLFVALSLHSRTYCQDETLYKIDPKIERDRHIVLLGKSKDNRNVKTVKVVKKKKTILYWTKMFSSNNFYFGEGDVFKVCPVRSCMGTNNRSYQDVDKFDAIMFHGPELMPHDLPERRSPHQRYIFMDSETQVFHPVRNNYVFYNFFNWTMAYRRDADIMRPYLVFKDRRSNETLPPYIPAQWVDVSHGNIPESARFSFKTKTKIAAWFVTHCSTHSKRENVAKELKKYVQVDIYGKCGEFECPRTKMHECYQKIESEYFFYLSFENSLCRDYITEKVFQALQYNVVPIVYGSADYESFLPPNSYINVMDFPSIEELADFLIKLSQDEEKYLSYFKWKNFYGPMNVQKYIICEFCKALHEPNLPNQVIEDIYRWWVDGSECTSPPGIV